MNKKHWVLVMVAVLATGISASADQLLLGGSSLATTTVGSSTGGYFYFYNNGAGNYGPYNSGLTTYDAQAMSVDLGSLSLPSNAVITAATLSWNIAGPTGTYPVVSTRSETSFSYITGYQWHSYRCGLFSTCYYEAPVYGYGYGGYASIYAGNSIGTGDVSFGDSAHIALGAPSGSVDLLALGFGSDLLAGPIIVSASGSGSMYADVYNWGYQGEAYYYPGLVSNTFIATATLDLTYSARTFTADIPTPTPEPASMLLIGSGVALLAGVLQRKR